MENKTAEETMTSKKLFARLLAKYIGIDEDPDIATEMIGKDIEVTALYNTCLEFSAICNDLTQQQLAEKDKVIESYMSLLDDASKTVVEKDKVIERLNDEKNEALRLLNDALKLIHSLPDLLHDSLGDHTAGNDYEITSLSGERYITHKWVGSGEPLKQWIKSEIDKSLNK